jgi:hypothetical protein
MEQFSLEKWLKDKSRKICTRRGNPVRILCTDRKHGEDELPVVFLEECSNGGEFLLSCKSDGTSDEHYATQYDLFFADEKKTDKILDELKSYLKNTPKEQVEKDWKEIQDWYTYNFTNEKHNEEEELTEFEKKLQTIISDVLHWTSDDGSICYFGDKEIKKISTQILDLARKEILKSFPMWKKITEAKQNYLAYGYLSHDGYYLSIQELKDKLPKEE